MDLAHEEDRFEVLIPTRSSIIVGELFEGMSEVSDDERTKVHTPSNCLVQSMMPDAVEVLVARGHP